MSDRPAHEVVLQLGRERVAPQVELAGEEAIGVAGDLGGPVQVQPQSGHGLRAGSLQVPASDVAARGRAVRIVVQGGGQLHGVPSLRG